MEDLLTKALDQNFVPVVDDFDAGILFVVESSIVEIAEHKDIDALSFEILGVVENKVLVCGAAA